MIGKIGRFCLALGIILGVKVVLAGDEAAVGGYIAAGFLLALGAWFGWE